MKQNTQTTNKDRTRPVTAGSNVQNSAETLYMDLSYINNLTKKT